MQSNENKPSPHCVGCSVTSTCKYVFQFDETLSLFSPWLRVKVDWKFVHRFCSIQKVLFPSWTSQSVLMFATLLGVTLTGNCWGYTNVCASGEMVKKGNKWSQSLQTSSSSLIILKSHHDTVLAASLKLHFWLYSVCCFFWHVPQTVIYPLLFYKSLPTCSEMC